MPEHFELSGDAGVHDGVVDIADDKALRASWRSQNFASGFNGPRARRVRRLATVIDP